MQHLLTILRAIAEHTRLRALIVLNECELTVSELVDILEQSQPSISRHLRLLCEAGLLERQQEGAHAFFRITDQTDVRTIIDACQPLIDYNEDIIASDQKRLAKIQAHNAQIAAEYFRHNADEWDKIRNFTVADSEIEKRMLELVTPYQPSSFIDFGTGTGRMLELFSPIIEKGLGVDVSKAMLKVARHNLQQAKIQNCRLQQADIQTLVDSEHQADLITIHQVLHYLDQPEPAIRLASSLLNDNGLLLIVDFLPHEFEFLRDDHAHRRLGFAPHSMQNWLKKAGLNLRDFKVFHNQKNDNNLAVGLWLAQKINT